MSKPPTFLHLLGKTGTGKSSTGNTLLGGPSKFKASASSTASTISIQVEETGIDSWNVKVVDGPGLVGASTGFSRQAMLEFKRQVNDNPSWGHVFLIVCRYGERFTSEDSGMVDALKHEFGRDIFKNHGVVLVTCLDNFEADHEDENMKFESWAYSQGGDFGKLVKDCGGRVLGVDNTKRGQGHQDLLLSLSKLMPSIDYGYSIIDSEDTRSSVGFSREVTGDTTPIYQEEPTGWRYFCFHLGLCIGCYLQWVLGCYEGCNYGCQHGCRQGCLAGCVQGCANGWRQGFAQCPS